MFEINCTDGKVWVSATRTTMNPEKLIARQFGGAGFLRSFDEHTVNGCKVSKSVDDFRQWCRDNAVTIYNYAYGDGVKNSIHTAELLSQFDPEIRQKVRDAMNGKF